MIRSLILIYPNIKIKKSKNFMRDKDFHKIIHIKNEYIKYFN